MYTEQDIADFTKLTDKLVKINRDKISHDEAAKIANDLRDVINFHDHRYYILAEPLVSDFEYDSLFKLLKHIGTEFPDLQSPDSPTVRVAFGLTKEFPAANHLTPMLSLDNSYDEADLVSFDKKVKQLSGQTEIEYSVEPKFDGTSISLVYENDKLVRAVTRGDGVVGEDVTPNVKTLKSVPLKANFSKFGIQTIEIRGEVIIQKETFKKFNKKREEEGLSTLANPRNAAAGSLRIQDAAEVSRRGLEAIMYHISYAVDKNGDDLLAETLHSRSENLGMLHQLGFKTPRGVYKVFPDIKKVLEYCDEWGEKRDEYVYEIDGMVIKVNDLHLEEKIGTTSHHPRWAMAFKFSARNARTKLLKIDYQVGRVGTITPVAKLEPVPVGGVIVSSASMFNEDFIKDKDIRIGDTVVVGRAGDVIPYISDVVYEARTGEEQPVVFPKECPSCGSELVRTEEEAAWRCVNSACPAQVFERILHFVSKDAMDIFGLGKAIVERFIFKEKWIKSIIDIYDLPYDEIRELEGFGEKSVEKLINSIENSKSRLAYRLLFGLGIRYVGETTARNLAEEVQCIEDLKDWDVEKLLTVKDIGPKVAQSVYNYFQQEENIETILKLKNEFGLNTCTDKQQRSSEDGDGKLAGTTLLFTGSLQQMARHEAKEMVEANGGKVASALSSKVDYLVVGEEPGSKVDKAKKLGTVKIITEDDFLKMIN
jgi:DNA ligase (NAD+)